MCRLKAWLCGYDGRVNQPRDRTVYVVPEHIHIHIDTRAASSDVVSKLNQILSALGVIQQKEQTMALDLSALVAEVADVVSTEQSAATVISAISAQLADLSAQLADQPAIQAQVDSLRSSLDTANAPLAAAVANVPGGGTPEAPTV